MINVTLQRLRKGPRRGFILLLVLGMLLLITLLVVAFLAHVLSQIKTVSGYRAQTGSLLLSDVAVDLVKAQIDDATSLPSSIWASQPGAIRTFQNSGSDATYGTMYKLYSSASLKSTNPPTDIPNDLPSTSDSSDWNGSPCWTDLNSPVQKGDGTYAYPIIDAYNDAADLPGATFPSGSAMPPSFSITSNTVGATSPLSTTPSTMYPVPMPVQWLYILKQGQIIAPDSITSSGTITFASASTVPTAANPIVGRVAYWTDDDTCRVNINTSCVSGTGGTTGIGSTSAINTFWDTPHFTAPDDFALGLNQPYNLEYQRYPGHPAMTTLALALPEFADPLGTGNVSTANLANILALTPRYGTGGSSGGNIISTSQTPLVFQKAGTTNTPPYRLYNSVSELLFNSPGPVASSTTRTTSPTLVPKQLETAKFFLTAHSRAPELNLFGLPRVAIWPICNTPGPQYRTATDNVIGFCATNNTTGTGTGAGNYYFTRDFYNVVGATAPPVGSNSPTSDVNLPRNVNLLNYLDFLTGGPTRSDTFPVPGFLGKGSSFDDKYGSMGKRQILTEMFDYIRMSNARDPGVDSGITSISGAVPYAAGNSYEYGNEYSSGGYGQIVPTVMLNTSGSGTGISPTTLNWGTYGFGRASSTVVNAGIMFIGIAKGPTTTPPAPATYPTGSINGFGQYQAGDKSYYGVSEYLLGINAPNPYWSYTSSTALNPAQPEGTGPTMAPVGANAPPPNVTAVLAMFFVDLFDPAQGYSRETNYINLKSCGLGGLTSSGLPTLSVGPVAGSTYPVTQSLFLRDYNERLCYLSSGQSSYDVMWGAAPGNLGGLLDFRFLFVDRSFSNTSAQYSSFSPITNMPTGGTFQFNGGTFNLNVAGPSAYAVGSSTTPVFRTYTLTFPPATLPVPGMSYIPITGTSAPAAPALDYWGEERSHDIVPSVVAPTSKDSSGVQYLDHMIDFANDTVISLIPTPAYGDYRMLASPIVPATAFQPHPNYTLLTPTQRLALDLMYPSGQIFQNTTTYSSTIPHGSLVSSASYYTVDTKAPITAVGGNYPALYGSSPVVPLTVSNPSAGTPTGGGPPPDFDNGFGELPDGPYINKADEGCVYTSSASGWRVYYDNSGYQVETPTNPTYSFSPQRQLPSPVMFGSLPTGAPVYDVTGKLVSPLSGVPQPWQTLLFQPGATGHMGLNAPKDEYLLDLFWMPQALPYAISEPFSTAGKVNLNYQIMPFTYIDRSTAIQSVLCSEKVAQVGAGQAGRYKNYSGYSTGSGMTSKARLPLNLSETTGTLRQFVEKFTAWTVFKAAAEICDVYLVPSGESWTSDATAQSTWYGSKYSLVGDNTREKPYADIYSRITTKSNSYTVFYRVQTLTNPASVPPATWTEGTGVITGEIRGSTAIERYLDPNVAVPDYAAMSSAGTLSSAKSLDSYNTAAGGNQLYYHWRVVENNRFAP